MARVTVEDCLKVVDNQYDLVILAKERTIQIGAGDKPKVSENNDKKTVLSLRELGDKMLDQKTLEEQTIDRAREYPDDATEQEEQDISEGDAFEEIYRGEVSRTGQAILPSKRSRKVPASNVKTDENSTIEDDDFTDDNVDDAEVNEVSEENSKEQNS